jgi:xylulokinase
VAVGTGDDFATPLVAGVCAPGVLVCVLGTAEVVGALAESALRDPRGLVETHGYPGGKFFIENPGWMAGGAMRWLTELLHLSDFEDFEKLAGQAPAGAAGVLCPPTLSGAMAPEWNASARGCFYGLSPGLGRAEMTRALLEGCAFAMRDVAQRLEELKVPCEHILLLGGGARSALWAQIRADVAQKPVVGPAQVDTCALGASALAAVASGAQPDLHRAATLLAVERTIYQPDPTKFDVYEVAYQKYRQLFDCLRPMFVPRVESRP